MNKALFVNYFSQAWIILLNLLAIPIYIKYLGLEAYAFVGFYTLALSWASILDFGMTPIVSRSMARLAGDSSVMLQSARLFRCIEIITYAIGAIIILIAVFFSTDFAESYPNLERINVPVASKILFLIGLTVALRYVDTIYRGALTGLQKFRLLSICDVIFNSVRVFGSLLLLRYSQGELIISFFIWQLTVILLAFIINFYFVYRQIPHLQKAIRPGVGEGIKILNFAGGISIITAMSAFVVQLDKAFLVKFVSLSDFGTYALLCTVSGIAGVAVMPISQIMQSKLTLYSEKNSAVEFSNVYHYGSQLVASIAGATTAVIACFSIEILGLWLDDKEIAKNGSLILRALVVATLLNVLSGMPYRAQIASGWTRLSAKLTLLILVTLIFLLFFLIPERGALGAAYALCVVNLIYIVFSTYFMHKNILKEEYWEWFSKDTLRPLVVSFLTGMVLSYLMPNFEDKFLQLVYLILSGITIMCASVMSVNLIRAEVLKVFNNNE